MVFVVTRMRCPCPKLQRLTWRYAWEILPLLGPDRDVPAPDVNTDDQVMGWFYDTVSMAQRDAVPGSVTGKPTALAGTACQWR